MIASSGNEINLGQLHCVRHGHDLNSIEDSFLGSVLKMPKPNCACITGDTCNKTARGGVVGRGTALKAGRWRVRFPVFVTGFFH